ncbi:MAG: ATP-binding protein [Cyanobacteriota bacterium]
MAVNPFVPQGLVGREQELQQVLQILVTDGDLVIAGVPGSGRRSLIRWAAQKVGARVVEIDCLRTTDGKRFLQLLAESLIAVFAAPEELALIEQWIELHPLSLEVSPNGQPRLIWYLADGGEWALFQILLHLPQVMAEQLNCRMVLVFRNFPHIRSWDKEGKWEAFLRQEIASHAHVSYALIATVAEPWMQDSSLQVVWLTPLSDEELRAWIESVMESQGLKFEPESHAIALFLNYVQGHLGEAIALARRIWLDCRDSYTLNGSQKAGIIQAHHVHRSALALMEDLSITYESLILLLPSSQAQVLESLAIDPTHSPHSREYIKKHRLSRGGSLQGALASLEHKGLVYGPKYGYRIALPLLSFWLKHRIG